MFDQLTKSQLFDFIAENGISTDDLGFSSDREMKRAKKATLAERLHQWQSGKKLTKEELAEKARARHEVDVLVADFEQGKINKTEAIKRLITMGLENGPISILVDANPSFVSNIRRGAYDRHTVQHEYKGFNVSVSYVGAWDSPTDDKIKQAILNGCSDEFQSAKHLREIIIEYLEIAKVRWDGVKVVQPKSEAGPTRAQKKAEQIEKARKDENVADILSFLAAGQTTKTQAIEQMLALNYPRPVVAAVLKINPSFVSNVDRGAYDRITLTLTLNGYEVKITYVGQRDEDEFRKQIEASVEEVANPADIAEIIKGEFKFVSKVKITPPDAAPLASPDVPDMPQA